MTLAQNKILVLDDDVRLRDLLSRYLTEQGFAVLTVVDGAAMDRALALERFDLLELKGSGSIYFRRSAKAA